MLLVIFNHTGSYGYFRFSETQTPALFWFYLVCAILCTMGVPLFFMVSGALLLYREESIGTVYRKRVFRIALVLLLFSALQYLYAVRFQGAAFDIKHFLYTIYTDSIVTPYWFLYTYLAMMLMLPLLRRMAGGMTRTEYRYLFALYLLFVGILPVAQYLLFRRTFEINLSLPLITTGALTFFLLGGYCERWIAPQRLAPRFLGALVGASAMCIAVSAFTTYRMGVVDGGWSEANSQTYLACLILVPAATLFLLLKALFASGRCPRVLAAAIRSLGSCTFGIYLFHAMLMDRLLPLFYALRERIDTFPACGLYVLAVFVCGYALTWLVKRISLVNRLL